MSKRNVVDCDRCVLGNGKDLGENVIKVSCVVGRSSDGIEFDDDTKYFDLCPHCAQIKLQQLLTAMTHEQAAEWVKKLQSMSR